MEPLKPPLASLDGSHGAGMARLSEPADLTSNQLRRRMIVASIVQTENNYVAALQTLRDYKRCLEESSPPILGVGKVHSLFYRIPEILQIHSLFRVALSERVRLWDQEEAIGDVFVASFTKGIVLDIYSEFINNFSTAMDLARSESKRKSSFADFLHAKQLVHSDRLSLFGLLVKPVQRFPQFILQLQDLLSATPHGHPDRLSLQLALSTLEVLADDLNERKREAEKGLALKETLRKINGRKLSGLLTTRSLSVEGGRSLIRSDDVTQLEFNSAGLISKMKRRRLLLTTDLVVCVSLPSEENGRVSLKWATSVGEIQVPFSGGTSLARTLPNHERIYATKEEVQESGGANATRKKVGSTSSLNAVSKGLSRSSPTSTYAGDSSCGNITDLIHDYEILKRVSGQLASLKGHYEALPVGEIEAVISDIQRTLRSRDSEVAWVDASCILIPVKNNKPPVSLQMASPQAKADWLRDLRLAQLATSENNSPAWDIPEAEKSRPLSRLPLFLDTVSCWDSPRPSEVTCGCVFIPRTSSPERGCDHPSAHARNLMPPSAPASSSSSSSLDPPASKRRAGGPSVWMASSDGVTSRLSAYRHVDGSSKALNPEFSLDLVGIVATAMEFVTGDDPSDPRDTVWIGTKCPSLLIYSATLSPMSPSPQPDTTLPLPSTPLAIAFVSSSSPRVFVALSSGSIAVISPSDPSLPSSTIHLRPSGPPTPVSALLPCPPFLYAACGDGVWVVDGENQQVLQNFQVEHDHESSSISLLAQSGIGLWLAMEGSGTVCLYHTETFKHLQDIDVRKSVSRFHPAQWSGQLHRPTPLAVTALRTGRGLLWVGTSIGAVLTIPLPRLEGLPIISSGRANVAVHMHQGPVHVILPVSFPMTPSPCDVGRSCLPPLSPPSSRSSSRSSSVDDLALDETSSGGAGENLLDVSSSQGSTVDHQPQPQGQHHPRHPQLRRRGSMSVTPGSAASMKPARKRPSQTLPRGFGGNVSPSFQEPEYDVYGLYEELLKDSCLNASPSTSSTGITKPASSDQSVKSYTKAHHYLKPPATKKPPGSSNASQPHTVLTITGGGGYVRRLPSGGTSTATGTRDSGFGGSNTSILNNVLTETSRHSTLMLWIAKP
ncbi:unnamed protein product [Cyprideis torosa]|uniref:Uncharacterized protein n=1 Tax=Cyprideis torosa TaxID=163714 RepID=A0A7R8W9Y9_9CRUS|nr:unnamed protein product [Cyprideis torosa]CAG0890315.1 unnamed protein product [Cyprideis torosa]